MAASNDLDDFFKKKDRKINKSKKPTGLLTNNEELLKQLGRRRSTRTVVETHTRSAFSDCHVSNVRIQGEHGFRR